MTEARGRNTLMSQVLETPTVRKAGEGLKVLVIDDNRNFAEAMAETLERIGYDCVVATSGTAGGRLIEQEDFDLIPTDLRPPDLDGLSILRKGPADLAHPEGAVIPRPGDFNTAPAAITEGAAAE